MATSTGWPARAGDCRVEVEFELANDRIVLQGPYDTAGRQERC